MIFVSSFFIFLFCLCMLYIWWVCNGFLIMEWSVFFGLSDVKGFWKIIWMFFWMFFFSFFLDKLEIFWFLKRIWLFVGLYRWIIVFFVVDLLYFDLLMMLSVFLCFSENEMLLIVFMFLIFFWKKLEWIGKYFFMFFSFKIVFWFIVVILIGYFFFYIKNIL